MSLKCYLGCSSTADPVYLEQPGLLRGASSHYSSAWPQLSTAERPDTRKHLGEQGLYCQTQARKRCPLPWRPSCSCHEQRSRSSQLAGATVLWEDTALHHPVLQPSQVLHHDVDEAGNEAGEDADHGTDHPALDLHCPESLTDRQTAIRPCCHPALSPPALWEIQPTQPPSPT